MAGVRRPGGEPGRDHPALTTSRIPATASGFSRLERSPGSSPIAAARIGAADDLGAPRLRELVDEQHARGRERLAEVVGHHRRGARRRARPSARTPGFTTTKHQIVSPLTSCGTPTAADSATAGCDASALSTSAGPSRLPATLSVSSRSPVEEPEAVLVDARPVAVHPDAGEPPPVRLEVALVVAPDAPRHGGPRLLADELPHLARGDRRPVASPDVDVHPQRGPSQRARLQLA